VDFWGTIAKKPAELPKATHCPVFPLNSPWKELKLLGSYSQSSCSQQARIGSEFELVPGEFKLEDQQIWLGNIILASAMGPKACERCILCVIMVNYVYSYLFTYIYRIIDRGLFERTTLCCSCSCISSGIQAEELKRGTWAGPKSSRWGCKTRQLVRWSPSHGPSDCSSWPRGRVEIPGGWWNILKIGTILTSYMTYLYHTSVTSMCTNICIPGPSNFCPDISGRL
jgi:hypothetical protein